MVRLPRKSSIRTCIGCRESDQRDAFLRLALKGDPPRVVPDLERRLMGRGAAIHPRRACFTAALKQRAFRRAWMREVVVTGDELIAKAEEQYRGRIEALLKTARRGRSVAVCTETVREAIQTRRAELIVVAADAAGCASEAAEQSVLHGNQIAFFGTEKSLGRLFGLGATAAVVALFDRALAQELTRAAACLAALAEVA